jgi:hypothetical protein
METGSRGLSKQARLTIDNEMAGFSTLPLHYPEPR